MREIDETENIKPANQSCSFLTQAFWTLAFALGRVGIDRMQKWLPINYSFIFVLISLTSLVSMQKKTKEFSHKNEASQSN